MKDGMLFNDGFMCGRKEEILPREELKTQGINPYSDKMSYRAWTAYKAEEETELSLSEGDIVTIIDQSDDDW